MGFEAGNREVLELSGGNVANGISITQNACSASTGQQWEFTTAADNTLALRNVLSAKVVEARNGGTGNATLVTQVADSGQAHQRWTIVPIG